MNKARWLVAVCVVALVGCKAPDQSKAPAPPLKTGGAPAAKTPSPGKRLKLAGIVFQEDQFFRMVIAGMKQAAKAHDVDLVIGTTDGKPEKEIALVNTYVADKVDAILISPLSRTTSIKALQAAHDKGVTIVTHNTPVDSQLPAAHIECDPKALGLKSGKAAREYVEKKLGGNAKVAMVHFHTQLPEQSHARIEGYKAELGKLKGVTNVSEQAAWVTEKAVKVVGDMLTAYPEIQVICCANEGATEGATLAVKNARKAGKVAVFGIDANEQLLRFLTSEDNILQATVSQRPVEVGRLAVEAALKALAGQPITPKVNLLDGTLLSRTDPAGVKSFEAQLKQWIALCNTK